MKDNKDSTLSSKDIIAKGSIIAIIVTIPSLTAFGISWYFLDDLLSAAIIGAVVHFLAMGFSFKISKKFFARKSNSQTDL